MSPCYFSVISVRVKRLSTGELKAALLLSLAFRLFYLSRPDTLYR